MTKDKYILANPRCEVTPHFPLHNDKGINAVQLHHILGANSSRNDHVSNIIRVKLYIHLWLETHKRAGHVLCLWIKNRKGEVDWNALTEIHGKQWPLCMDTDLYRECCEPFPWVEKMRRELIR